ncbi:MAG: hypothetical protein JNK50_01880 [Bacteroidia bacterium]|nr:hypothetical protein [Bacteroidia bacterium]
MKRALILSFSLFSFFCVNAQTERELKEQHNALKANQMAVKSEVVVSKYGNLEKEIVDALIKRQIPAGFPEFNEKTETVDAYKSRINVWYKNNLDLLNPEFRKKLIESQK